MQYEPQSYTKEFILQQFSSLVENILEMHIIQPLIYFADDEYKQNFLLKFDKLIEPFSNPIVFIETRTFFQDFINLSNNSVGYSVIKVLGKELIRIFTKNITFLLPNSQQVSQISLSGLKKRSFTGENSYNSNKYPKISY